MGQRKENYQPLVSVIMNCYNGERYLEQAIHSVLNQSYTNWELIFWNDQSTDNSENVFKQFHDKRLKYYLSSKRTNLSKARVLAIDKSEGDIITFLDVDDYWCNAFIETQVSLYKDEAISFSCGNFYIFTEGSTKKKKFRKEMPSGKVVNDLLVDYSVGLLTLAVRRSAYFDVGGFSPKYHIIGDFDLVMRLAQYGKMGSFKTPLAYCRKHEKNESNLKINIHLKELKEWYEKNRLFFEVTNKKAINHFYVSILYKEYTDQINANLFSMALLAKSYKTQTVFNFIKLSVRFLLRKV